MATWPAMEEREKRGINEELVEVCGGWNFGKDWNFGKWKSLWLVEEGRDLKKKEKGKEFKREDIFLVSKIENVEKD